MSDADIVMMRSVPVVHTGTTITATEEPSDEPLATVLGGVSLGALSSTEVN